MNAWDYFRSFVIFLAAVYFVNDIFHIDLLQSVVLVLLMAVCVFHTMDIRDHIYAKVAEKRRNRGRK